MKRSLVRIVLPTMVLLVVLVSCTKPVFTISVDQDLYDRFVRDGSAAVTFSAGQYDLEITTKNENNPIAHVHRRIELSPALQNLILENPECYPHPAVPTEAVTEAVAVSECIVHREPVYPVIPFTGSLTTYAAFHASEMKGGAAVPVYVKQADIPAAHIALPAVVVSGNDTERVLFAGDAEYPWHEDTLAVLTYHDDSAPLFHKKAWHGARSFLETWFRTVFCPQVCTPGEDRTAFIASAGDILLARGVDRALIRTGKAETVFTTTLPVLQNNDLTTGNLECVITQRTNNATKTYTFRADEAALPFLKEAGFSYVSIANNHSYDFGEPGFRDTLAALGKHELATSGAGYTDTDAAQFYRTTLGGNPVSVISCGAFPVERSGFNGKTTATATGTRAGILWESDLLRTLIRREKEAGYFIVVLVHGGEEYTTNPSPGQKATYRSLCDSGADVIFGSHPHVLQPVEYYKNSLIVYSLGNFVFPGMDEMPGAEESAIVRIGIKNNQILYYEKYPCTIEKKTVRLADQD